MFCPKCGKEIPNQATFCPKCGAAVSSAVKSAAPETPSPAPHRQTATATTVKPKRKGRIKLILAIAAVVIVLFAAVSIFGGSSGAPDDQTGDPDEEQTGEESPISTQEGTGDAASEEEAELLAILDHAYTYYEDTVIKSVSEESAKDRGTVQALNDTLVEMEKLREKAETLSRLDSKLKAAKDEFFNMICDFSTALKEAYQFLGDFTELDNNIISHQPA